MDLDKNQKMNWIRDVGQRVIVFLKSADANGINFCTDLTQFFRRKEAVL
jgi:hypothetical protein